MKNILLLLTILIALIVGACGDEGFDLPATAPSEDVQFLSEKTLINNPLLPGVLMTPLAKKVLESTVYVIAETSEGVFQGSGFVVKDEMIATAYHIVKSQTPVKLWVQLVFSDQYLYTETVVAHDPENDISVFHVAGLSAPPLPLADSNFCYIGQRIFVAGNPRGLVGTWSHGIISAIRQGAYPDHHETVIQFTAATSKSSSGSPVVNLLGDVIGISSFQIEGNDLTFAAPSNALRNLLSDATLPPAQATTR